MQAWDTELKGLICSVFDCNSERQNWAKRCCSLIQLQVSISSFGLRSSRQTDIVHTFYPILYVTLGLDFCNKIKALHSKYLCRVNLYQFSSSIFVGKKLFITETKISFCLILSKVVCSLKEWMFSRCNLKTTKQRLSLILFSLSTQKTVNNVINIKGFYIKWSYIFKYFSHVLYSNLFFLFWGKNILSNLKQIVLSIWELL